MTVPATPAGEVRRDVVVVGASAGGVESLRAFVRALPEDLPAALLVVLHLPPEAPSVLDRILGRVSRLPVSFVRGGEELAPGRIWIAPPDRHLMVVDDRLLLTRGPRENSLRPSIDVLFRSAARALGQRVISVVLSGMLDDGTAGSLAVGARGGAVLVQDPDEAAYPGMPQSVVATVAGAQRAGVDGLAAEVDRLCRTPVARVEHEEASEVLTMEVELAAMEESAVQAAERPGVPAGFGCPECFGSMFQIEDSGMLRFRCRVGHAWTAAGLLAKQAEAMEAALWVALRSLEEKAALSRQLADRAVERGSTLTALRFQEQAQDTSRSADQVRHLIESMPSLGSPFELVEDVAAADV